MRRPDQNRTDRAEASGLRLWQEQLAGSRAGVSYLARWRRASAVFHAISRHSTRVTSSPADGIIHALRPGKQERDGINTGNPHLKHREPLCVVGDPGVVPHAARFYLITKNDKQSIIRHPQNSKSRIRLYTASYSFVII
ncbi:MAG: hypothetical protein SNJ69_14975 [Chloroflexaceae bacterium]